jgi:hypothetical protein
MKAKHFHNPRSSAHKQVNNRLVAVGAFGDGKALFPTGFVKFLAEYARFRLQNLPHQSKK